MGPESPKHTSALFVSPHFDDVALSCGGTAARAARRGTAEVVTVFAGRSPVSLSPFARFQHERWGYVDAVDVRRQEDRAAMAILGARYRWLDFPDAIYRDDLYQSDEELFGPVKAEDEPIVQSVSRSLVAFTRQLAPRQVYLPLSVGQHVDHQICTSLAPTLAMEGAEVRLYEDVPYALTPGAVDVRIRQLGWSLSPIVVEIDDDLERRLAAIHCYASQLPTIFRHLGDPDEVVRAYAASLADRGYAERFWRFEGSG